MKLIKFVEDCIAIVVESYTWFDCGIIPSAFVVVYLIPLVLFIGLIIVHKKIFYANYKKGLILFAVVLLIIQLLNGLMFGDIIYGFMETIDVLGFGQFVGYFVGACLALSSIAYILDRKC